MGANAVDMKSTFLGFFFFQNKRALLLAAAEGLNSCNGRTSKVFFYLRPAMVERSGRTPRPPEDQKTCMVDRMVA